MLKYTIVLGFVSLSLIMGCGAGKPTSNLPLVSSGNANPLPVASAKIDNVVSFTGDNWSFTCPNNNWKESNTNLGTLAIINNFVEKRRIVFLNVSGVENISSPDFLDQVLVGAKASGANIGEPKQVVINNNTFTLVPTTSDEVNINIWFTIKNGFGYVFMCGGSPASNLDTECNSIFSTLKIN